MFLGPVRFLNDPIKASEIESALRWILFAVLVVVVALTTFIAFTGHYVFQHHKAWTERPPFVQGLVGAYEAGINGTLQAIWVAGAIGLMIMVPYVIVSIARS